MVNTGNSYKALVGKPEEKEPVSRPRCRWKHDVYVFLKYYVGTLSTGKYGS
jgi:hypothetical protein